MRCREGIFSLLSFEEAVNKMPAIPAFYHLIIILSTCRSVSSLCFNKAKKFIDIRFGKVIEIIGSLLFRKEDVHFRKESLPFRKVGALFRKESLPVRKVDVLFRKVHLHTLLKDDSIFRNGNFQIKNRDSII